MAPKELVKWLRQDPMDMDITCAVHGPLESLRMLPQVFRDGAKAAETDPEDDADNWEFLPGCLEGQLNEFADLPDETIETLKLEFDLSADLEYVLAIAQARPELEIAAAGFLVGDTMEDVLYPAWYSPAGSGALAPTKPENDDLPSYIVHDVREKDGDGRFCTGDWGFPESVQEWFPLENIVGEGPGGE